MGGIARLRTLNAHPLSVDEVQSQVNTSTTNRMDVLTAQACLKSDIELEKYSAEPVSRCLADTGAAEAAIAPRILSQVLLVIILAIVKRAGRLNLGGDLTITGRSQG